MMTSSNLAICVGPSLLWSSENSVMIEQNYSKDVSKVCQILIDEYFPLFGDALPYVFCKGVTLESTSAHEESETNNRTYIGTTSGHAQVPAIVRKASKNKPLIYDNSSLDSLLDGNNFVENDLGQQMGTTTEGISLTNLSHDSGLTTSDSQLYAFEEHENNSFSSDDFCIETISGSGAKTHAVVNKRFLTKYPSSGVANHYQQSTASTAAAAAASAVHPHREYNLPGQVPNLASGSSVTPATVGQGQQQPQSANKNQIARNRDRMYRRIYKHDDIYGRKYLTENEAEQDSDNVIKTKLRRTTSSENIQNQSVTTSPLSREQQLQQSAPSARKNRRPAAHRKGRAPAPPKGDKSIVRSNSVNQVRSEGGSGNSNGGGGRSSSKRTDWYRSRSTTRLNCETTSSSCSTLSDEDSTPHVSRSNSYGRSEESGGGAAFRIIDNDVYDIYLTDDHVMQQHQQQQQQQKARSQTTTPLKRADTSFDTSFNCDTPPGYEETISRQRLLKHYHRSNSYIAPSSSTSSTTISAPLQQEPMLIEQIIDTYSGSTPSSKQKLFSTSFPSRNDFETSTTSSESPPPLPPKTERPPLPPKQKIRHQSNISNDDTYANSAELRSSYHNQFSSETSEFVYPNYTAPASGTRIHVSSEASRSTKDMISKKPSLPPKESSSNTSPNKSAPSSVNDNSKKKRSVTKTRISATSASTQTRTMKNAETQTDENDFYMLYQDEDGYFRTESDEEDFSESNRSVSPEYYPSSFRKNSIDNPEYLHSDQMSFERPVSAQPSTPMELRQAGRRKLEPVQSVPVNVIAAAAAAAPSPGDNVIKTNYNANHLPPNVNSSDPIIQGEINWSVSQLRSLFNQGQQNERSSSPSTVMASSPFPSPSRGSISGDGNSGRQNHMPLSRQQQQNHFRNAIYSEDIHQEPDSDQESYV